MLKFNTQQMAEFSEASARGFVDRMVQRVTEKLGVGPVPLSEAELLDKVEQAILRAGSHHITSENDVRRFIDLTLELGERFDVDPALPWVGELLDKVSPGSASAIVDALCEQAANRQESGAGSAELQTGSDEQLTGRASVGDPVERCPPMMQRRLYMFSS